MFNCLSLGIAVINKDNGMVRIYRVCTIVNFRTLTMWSHDTFSITLFLTVRGPIWAPVYNILSVIYLTLFLASPCCLYLSFLLSIDSSLLQDNVAFVLCLDTVGNGDSLHLHVSKPPKEGTPQYSLLKELEIVRSPKKWLFHHDTCPHTHYTYTQHIKGTPMEDF